LANELIINYRPYETRVALLENGKLAELYIERKNSIDILGNIYKGKVVRVLPGIQAAFVNIGLERTGFLCLQDLSEYEHNNGSLSIEDLLYEGQDIMVQVAKEPTKNKGARLTTNISLPGRRLVLMPFSRHIGISRKIKDKNERERLKEIIEEIRPKDMGIIIRTISKGATKEKLKTEMEFLLKVWENIKTKAQRNSVPILLYKELSITLKAVRDLFTMEVDRLIIDSFEEYTALMSFINSFAPGLRYSIEFYEESGSIFEHYGIESEILKTLQRRVWLKSGGYIVIEQTEALTAIDVNTGSYVGENNPEETVLKTNLEAVKEIAYQIRLRNIGGLIVIDFIDMNKKSNRDKVFNALKEAFNRDKAKTNILYISSLGLVEMTRERTRSDLRGFLAETCPYCSGRGLVRSRQSISYEIFRELERKRNAIGNDKIHVFVHPDVNLFIKEYEQNNIKYLENTLNRKIVFIPKNDLHIEKYEIVS